MYRVSPPLKILLAPGVLRIDELMRPPAAVSATLMDSLRSLRRVVTCWRISRISEGGNSGEDVEEDISRAYLIKSGKDKCALAVDD